MQVAIENEADVLASIAKAESGEHVTLTRQGVAVAQIVPLGEHPPLPQSRLKGRERDEAIERLRELLTIGIPLEGVAPTKDEMHGRD